MDVKDEAGNARDVAIEVLRGIAEGRWGVATRAQPSFDPPTTRRPARPTPGTARRWATTTTPTRGRLHRWLREPLLHFIVARFAPFALDGALHEPAGRNAARRIVVTADDVRRN
jgi:hypothetical protein